MTCAAHGCRIPGGIKDGNAWLCRFHFGEEAHKWPRITEIVNSLAGLNSVILKVSQECMTQPQFQDRMTKAMEGRYPALVPFDGELIGEWQVRAGAFINAAVKQIPERIAA